MTNEQLLEQTANHTVRLLNQLAEAYAEEAPELSVNLLSIATLNQTTLDVVSEGERRTVLELFQQ